MAQERRAPGYDSAISKINSWYPMKRTPQKADMLPPHNLDAEAGALGCAILEPSLAGELSLDWFYDVRHQNIAKRLRQIANNGKAPDQTTLLAQLGPTEPFGGSDYIASLPDKAPSSANFEYWRGILNGLATRRRLLKTCEDISRAAREDEGDPDALVAESIQYLNAQITAPVTLPPMLDAAEFVHMQYPQPTEIVYGVLHQGCKLTLGGGSKTNKTWTFIDLSLAVSHGEPWLSFKTTRAKVVYVNLELPEWSFHERLVACARSKQIDIDPHWLKIWNLRGYCAPHRELLPKITDEIKDAGFGLVIVDPVYKIYGETDENSAKDIAALMNGLERVTRDTGAAIAYASHFSKGNQAGREHMDRISGSGVFARDPDAILTFTSHEETDAYTVDLTLRNF